MNALIFGSNGQDGYYLIEICKINNVETIGVSHSGGWLKGDVSCYDQVEHLIKEYHPTFIFHLAAKSTTRHDALFENHETISTGTLNILEAVKRHNPDSRVFITGSGVQFENKGMPISETDNIEASSPYAIARIQSVYAGGYYRKLRYVRYLFHHESPLRQGNHISKVITDTVKRIDKGSDEKILLGNLMVKKEWAWVEICFNKINKNLKKYVSSNFSFSPEYKMLVSYLSTINSIGWKPRVQFDNLCTIMMSG
jgi:GDPmannose 4,6-dehydratase